MQLCGFIPPSSLQSKVQITKEQFYVDSTTSYICTLVGMYVYGVFRKYDSAHTFVSIISYN